MNQPAPMLPVSDDLWSKLRTAVLRHWGYRDLWPLQQQAMDAALAGRDSLVVLPTGGGKSLCYQAPAVVRGDTMVVVSPLISLMKDQVDALRACGVPAIQIDSSLSAEERFANEMDIRQGAVRLVYVSPERLGATDFHKLLHQIGVRHFAIDEAHCISHWGHDFRPEYRQMSRLRAFFPNASIHAYTATATERVRRDIIQQLGLKDPEVLVGNFDRPNLVYRIVPRRDVVNQAREVIERHAKEPGIIYCIRRRDVDDLTAALQGRGIKALPYHAGMAPEERRATQNDFAAERCDLVVATVAFGMGINRSNIRFVLHTGMPKSVEHYQQETGRAGRDGLEAECILLHSGGDFVTWKTIIEKSSAEAGVSRDVVDSALKHLNDMDRYCRGAVCRHRALVEYFGQSFDAPRCSACDLCLDETEGVPEAAVVAQKILSCVARVKEGFGINHVVGVLRGENTENIRKRGHDQLTTFGLLKSASKADVRDWIYQLIGQGFILQVGEEYPVLKLNEASWEVMKGKRPVRLVQMSRKEKPEKTKPETVSWEGVDRGLFDALRDLRRRLAEERDVPPYVVFHDTVIRELARVRPSTLEKMRTISGIGDNKLREFGSPFLQAIDDYCRDHHLNRNQAHAAPVSRPDLPRNAVKPNPSRDKAFELFRQGAVIEDVMHQTNKARGTVTDYLCDFIHAERPASLQSWLPADVYKRVEAAARQQGMDRLKPIFLALGESVPYEQIRLVLAHLAGRGAG
ncbi:MAG: DNA helicase RecQ [Gemmataceae bacterium]